MVCDDVLRIKHLPRELSRAEKEDFLQHFGAVGIKIITNSKQNSVAFAKFSSKEIAKSVMLRLHQVQILNSRLCIEYAEHDVTETLQKKRLAENVDTNNKEYFKSFVTKLNALNSTVSFHQPPPPHLKYTYPKSNRATINNIAHALASVPKFYTQVLHLMNRMNLPPPFSNVPDPPPNRQRTTTQTKQLTTQPQEIQLSQNEPAKSSSESELESDPENVNKTEIIPQKRKLPGKKTIKRPKLMKLVIQHPTSTSKVSEKPEDVFETTQIQVQKKIEVKVSNDCLEKKIEENPKEIGSFGIMSDNKNADVPLVTSETAVEISENVFITEAELEANRIKPNELNVLPVFKNYHPGAPTCRLYIKNIAKNVEVKDLEFIYKRYDSPTEGEAPNHFDIRLMQEGKMKGQAFVTLNSVPLAQKALKETNGYILKTKPLVVLFARSAAPKK